MHFEHQNQCTGVNMNQPRCNIAVSRFYSFHPILARNLYNLDMEILQELGTFVAWLCPSIDHPIILFDDRNIKLPFTFFK